MKIQKLYEKLIGILIIHSVCIACQSDKEKKTVLPPPNPKKYDTLTYQTYGPPPELYYAEAEAHIYAKYGVKVNAVAGCALTEELRKSIVRHNDSLFAFLAKKYHNLTPDNIVREIQDFAARSKSISESLEKFSKDRAHLLGKDNYPRIKWVSDQEKDYYLVDYFANRTSNHKPDTLLWKLKVNPKTGEILIRNIKGERN